MANKHLVKKEQKANTIVANAIGTFTQAITEVEKANVILAETVDLHNTELERLTKQIEDASKQMEIIQDEKINKIATIRCNKDLIAKLERFTN